MEDQHRCNYDDDTQWILAPHKKKSLHGESRFECVVCGNECFRGGWDPLTSLAVDRPMTHADIEQARIEAGKFLKKDPKWVNLEQLKLYLGMFESLNQKSESPDIRREEPFVFKKVSNSGCVPVEFICNDDNIHEVNKDKRCLKHYLVKCLDFLILKLSHIRKDLSKQSY